MTEEKSVQVIQFDPFPKRSVVVPASLMTDMRSNGDRIRQRNTLMIQCDVDEGMAEQIMRALGFDRTPLWMWL